MNKQILKKPHLLLLVPITLSYFACYGFGFGIRAAVTGSCIFILGILYQKRFKTNPVLWFIFMPFTFLIVGDWFMSSKGASLAMFSGGIGFFFLAHVGFLVFALSCGRINKLLTALLLVGYLLFFFFCLFPAIDNKLFMTIVTPYLMAYSVTGEKIDVCTIPESWIFLQDIPNMPFGSHFAGEEAILDKLSENIPAVIINNDSILVTGDKLFGTFDRLEVAEFSAKSLTMGAFLRKLIPISDEQDEELWIKFLD